jgi:hypothetical protein
MYRVKGLTLALPLEPVKASSGTFYSLEVAVVLLFGLIGVVYALLHLLVIMPLAYVAYLAASVPLDAIRASSADVSLRIGEQAVALKAVVAANAVAIKSFVVTASAASLVATIKILALCRRGARAAMPADKTVQKPPADFEF